MSNLAKIYSDATTIPKEEEPKSLSTEEQISIQMRIDWFNHPVTREFVEHISSVIEQLETSARSGAMLPIPINTAITRDLIAAQTLREKVINYVKQ